MSSKRSADLRHRQTDRQKLTCEQPYRTLRYFLYSPVKLTGNSRNQSEGSQDSERSQSFDVQTSRFPRHVMSGCLLARLMSHRLQDDAEQPAQTTIAEKLNNDLENTVNTCDIRKMTKSDIQQDIMCIKVEINIVFVNVSL